MKKMKVLAGLLLAVCMGWGFSEAGRQDLLPFSKGVPIPASPQKTGDTAKGYEYLVYGDYLKSGLPMRLFNLTKPRMKDYLKRAGRNTGVPYPFNIIDAPNGATVAAPNCLFCHAQVFNDRLIIGMGNALSRFSVPQQSTLQLSALAYRILANQKERQAGENILRYTAAAAPYMVTASRGVNIADRLTAVLAAHRDPVSFRWLGKPELPLSAEVVPSDVPAWWLLKKKNGMFYTGFGRGDFSKFLMAANLLTVNDTSEAAEVLPHFDDVLAYIYSLKPPRFPLPVNEALAKTGKALFEQHCASCHGTYGEREWYPNLLIPAAVIKTDSALAVSHFSDSVFTGWFKKSWFTMGSRKAELSPFNGYIAPPLDGVWATAPYLHNGSVPDIASLLNSATRPVYWQRHFKKPVYNYQRLGWEWRAVSSQKNDRTYNTTLYGYGNGGHTFGDKLSEPERQAILEYLKTI